LKHIRRSFDTLQCFLFVADNDRWLSVLRIGFGIQLFCYSLSLRSDWNYFFSETGTGLIGRTFSEALLSRETPLVPQLGWLVAIGARAGLSEWTALSITWWILFLAACALLIGIFSRGAAIVSWFFYLCASKSGGLAAYGVDNFTTVGLFYLMLPPLPDRFALDWQWRKRQSQDRHRLGFFRRLLQLHLCLIYFFSGLTKALGRDWWNGINLWRALTRPPFDLISADILVRFKHFLPIAGIAVFALELGYPFFIWLRQMRRPWLVAVLIMHLGIGITMGMYLFASVMIVLNLAAFGPGILWSAASMPNNRDVPSALAPKD
jgi:hypothetical protein